MLLETVALCAHQNLQSDEAWHAPRCRHPYESESQRPLERFQDLSDTNGHDQPMVEGPRTDICQRTMGETSLPGYGPVGSVNRLVRTRLPGGVGAGGEKPPATRFGILCCQKIIIQKLNIGLEGLSYELFCFLTIKFLIRFRIGNIKFW